jgi:hypothetical protein
MCDMLTIMKRTNDDDDNKEKDKNEKLHSDITVKSSNIWMNPINMMNNTYLLNSKNRFYKVRVKRNILRK